MMKAEAQARRLSRPSRLGSVYSALHRPRLEFVLLFAVLAVSVLPRITSSLWLDETETWCIVKDRLGDAWGRGMLWGATPPLYYCLVWGVTKMLGLSEPVLRMLSVLFSVGTAAMLYRLGRRWLDREGAALAVFFLFSVPSVQFAVIDARSYAPAMFMLVGAWLAMMRWLDRGSGWDGVILATCVAGVIWFHYAFAVGLIPLAWYWRRLGWRRIAFVVVGSAVLLAPLAAQIGDRIARRQAVASSMPPDAVKLVLLLVPFQFLILIYVGAMMTLFSSKLRTEDYKLFPARQSLVPLALLAVLPPGLLFFLSRAGVLHIFEPRYLLCKELGVALLTAWAFRGFGDPKVRYANLAAAAVLAVTWNALFAAKHGQQDWRASSEWVAAEFQAHPGMQFVLVSGFVESSQPGRLDDPAYHDLLMAPQIVYPVPVSPILLPLRPNAEAARRLLESVAPAARQAERLVVVSCTMGPQYKSLFAESLRASGLRLTQEKSFGEVIGHVYERRE